MLIESDKIGALTVPQQVELLEKVSTELAKNSGKVSSPAWHKGVLDSRDDSLQKSENWLCLNEVKRNFRKNDNPDPSSSRSSR
jgi:hypothetical protein